MEHRSFLTVPQFSVKHPAFTQSSLRGLIFNAKSRQSSQGMIEGNGLAPAIIRIGRKVLIDEEKFLAWVDNHQQNGQAA
ncbi:MAG: hypothetical protein Q9O24_07755 [Gammaproteobacteria bacterium]|nr:hypothetical protein [Gammaproteobacteria bacterium]